MSLTDILIYIYIHIVYWSIKFAQKTIVKSQHRIIIIYEKYRHRCSIVFFERRKRRPEGERALTPPDTGW